MKKISWGAAILRTIILLAVISISGCKKEEKTNLDVCLSSYQEDILIVADYEREDFCKRSIIYRSTDNKNYGVVGEIKTENVKNGQGVFIDTSLIFEGEYFYKVSYGNMLSKENAIHFKKGNNPVRIFPNPFSDSLTIAYNPTCMPYDAQIFDLVGRLVFSENQISTNQKQLHLTTLPNGIYLLKITIGTKTFAYRVLKQ